MFKKLFNTKIKLFANKHLPRSSKCKPSWYKSMLNQCINPYINPYQIHVKSMLPNIPGMSSNIPGNIAKHSGECPIYFDGKGIVEASSITDVFFGELLIVCCVIFCVENLSKLLAARLNSGENLISVP